MLNFAGIGFTAVNASDFAHKYLPKFCNCERKLHYLGNIHSVCQATMSGSPLGKR